MTTTRNCVVLKDMTDLKKAKASKIVRLIFFEDSNVINIWARSFGKWVRAKYVACDEDKEIDYNTTGFEAYLDFYNYAGNDKIEEMKQHCEVIDQKDSYEQLHYFNYEMARQKIYQDIYVLDVNSSFTYGITQLPKEFDILKEYMLKLYEKKKNAKNKITRNRYKNLQNYLIGYFARVKEFVWLRSEIIKNSNMNVLETATKIKKGKGLVYLCNTDSIVTDLTGYNLVKDQIGDELGQFKLEKVANRLYYKSSNCYQLDDKVTYSGVKYFARKHIDFFDDKVAIQYGSLLDEFDGLEIEDGLKVVKVRLGKIEVKSFNPFGEVIEKKVYKMEEQ